MTARGSRAARTITRHPALPPSPQRRPDPTARALIDQSVERWGPSWMSIRGPDWAPIDTLISRDLEFRSPGRGSSSQRDVSRLGEFHVAFMLRGVADKKWCPLIT